MTHSHPGPPQGNEIVSLPWKNLIYLLTKYTCQNLMRLFSNQLLYKNIQVSVKTPFSWISNKKRVFTQLNTISIGRYMNTFLFNKRHKNTVRNILLNFFLSFIIWRHCWLLYSDTYIWTGTVFCRNNIQTLVIRTEIRICH